MYYIPTHDKEIKKKNLQKHWPAEILQFAWTKVLTVECFRDCPMPLGSLRDMASFLSLLNILKIIPTHHVLMPGHSQTSNITGVDEEKMTKLLLPLQL